MSGIDCAVFDANSVNIPRQDIVREVARDIVRGYEEYVKSPDRKAEGVNRGLLLEGGDAFILNEVANAVKDGFTNSRLMFVPDVFFDRPGTVGYQTIQVDYLLRSAEERMREDRVRRDIASKL